MAILSIRILSCEREILSEGTCVECRDCISSHETYGLLPVDSKRSGRGTPSAEIGIDRARGLSVSGKFFQPAAGDLSRKVKLGIANS